MCYLPNQNEGPKTKDMECYGNVKIKEIIIERMSEHLCKEINIVI